MVGTCFYIVPEGLGILEGLLQECIVDSTERGCRHTSVQEMHKQSSNPVVERSWIVNSGCSSTVEQLIHVQQVVSSNLAVPTI